MNFKHNKPRQGGSPKRHMNKKPNPTNFSNLRSQQYLNQPDSENIEPNTAMSPHIPEQIFELSSDCSDSIVGVIKLLDRSKKEYAGPSKIKIGLPDSSNKENVLKLLSGLLPAHTPLSNRPMYPLMGNTTKPASGKVLWGDTAHNGISQKITPKSESPHQESRKFHKLSQKVLPFTTLETELDCSVDSHPTDIERPDVKDTAAPLKELENKAQPQAELSRSKSENKKEPAGLKINMEDSINIEDTLWKILEGLRTGSDIFPHCRRWWLLTERDSLPYFDKLFKDVLTRRTLRRTMILETMAVALSEYILYERLLGSCLSPLKNLLFYVHQNYLLICDAVLAKLPLETINHNAWATQLRSILILKKSHKGKKGEYWAILASNNATIAYLIQSVCKSARIASKGSKEFVLLNCITNLFKQIEKCSAFQAREVVSKALEISIGMNGDNLLDSEESDLPTVEPPYLAPLLKETVDNTYTLVLDLDETLVHYYETETEGRVLVRPGTEEFLQAMSECFEVVIFTAAMQDYADWVLDQIDPNKCIKHRLYRQHTIKTEKCYIKDLSRIGRDLKRIIIVDNLAENFQLQQENGILIKSWLDDPNDTALFELAPILKEIATKKVHDVRDALNTFSMQINEQNDMGLQCYQLSLDI